MIAFSYFLDFYQIKDFHSNWKIAYFHGSREIPHECGKATFARCNLISQNMHEFDYVPNVKKPFSVVKNEI